MYIEITNKNKHRKRKENSPKAAHNTELPAPHLLLHLNMHAALQS